MAGRPGVARSLRTIVGRNKHVLSEAEGVALRPFPA